jgi:hypothetical protein
VICNLTVKPVGKLIGHPHKLYEYDSLPTRAYPGHWLLIDNVNCSLYLDTPRLTRATAVAQLRAASNELRSR